MATTLYTRSYNPIWDFRSLTGLPLDDTSWAYFLENDIPYLPQTVYQNENGTPWPSPVQLSAAGTLQNIFFDPTKVYRIEIRTNLDNLTPPTQADPLVWLIEDYVPSGGSINPPITTGAIVASNQITNAQFSLINFASPLTLTNQTDQTISIAPGWDLVLTGTAADITLTRLALTSDTTPNPTNAPYALELNLTGWTTAYLRQRFEQNGILWAGKNVTGSLTARINLTPQVITGTLVDSQSNLLRTVLTGTVTANYTEITGNALLPASTDTQSPPDAYIEYRINLPGSSDISITSIQLVSTNNAVALTYEQDTINRQIDHTFNVFKDSILTQSKDSILTGWDFPLNPWQFQTRSLTTLTGGGGYVADQTVIITEAPSSVQVSQAVDGFLQIDSITSVTQGRIAVIQFIDPRTCASVWESVLSSLAKVNVASVTPGLMPSIKMRLIASNSLPTSANPIASWGTTDPVFDAQWTDVLSPVADPEYALTDTLSDYAFNGFITPPLISDTQTLGIVFYTTGPMSDAVVESLFVKSISLVENEVAIETNHLSFDETLRRCQYYYEKTYRLDVFPGTVDDTGSIIEIVPTIFNSTTTKYRVNLPAFSYKYMRVKRTETPDLTFYSPATGLAGKVILSLVDSNTPLDSIEADIASYTFFECNESFQMIPVADQHVEFGLNLNSTGRLNFHFVADARLGIVP